MLSVLRMDTPAIRGNKLFSIICELFRKIDPVLLAKKDTKTKETIFFK